MRIVKACLRRIKNKVEVFKKRYKQYQKERIPYLVKKRSKNGIMAIDVNTRHGLGSKLTWSLEIMLHCEENNKKPYFKYSYPDVLHNEDFFSPIFIEKDRINKKIEYTEITNILDFKFKKDYNKLLDLKMSSYLVKKYISIKPEILKEIDEFCSKNFNSKKVAGLHYRGTDKHEEAPSVSYEEAKDKLEKYLKKTPTIDTVFVASDDVKFIKFIRESSLPYKIVYREDSARSDNGKPVHLQKNRDRKLVNKDAIINSLLLSRCNILIKTSSTLSAWSKIFNPDLPVIMLNRPYDDFLWFPEKELVEQSDAYLEELFSEEK